MRRLKYDCRAPHLAVPRLRVTKILAKWEATFEVPALPIWDALPPALGWNNCPDNYNATPCPFLSPPPGPSHHILMMLPVCLCWWWILPGKIIYLSPPSCILSSVYLSWCSVSFLSCSQTPLSLPLCNAQQAGEACRLLLWESCVGKCHSFMQRTWPDLSNSENGSQGHNLTFYLILRWNVFTIRLWSSESGFECLIS